jgi:hypothetical protein
MRYRLRTLMKWFEPTVACIMGAWCIVSAIETPDPIFRAAGCVLAVFCAVSARYHAKKAMKADLE